MLIVGEQFSEESGNVVNLPCPIDHLLVDLEESYDVIISLLENMPLYFK